jgi:hypothetical protein
MANGHGGRRPGAGKKKGTVHPQTRAAKEAIELAFEGIGGVPRLIEWANKNPDVFFSSLFPRLLPVQMQHSGNSEDRTPINVIKLVGPRDN